MGGGRRDDRNLYFSVLLQFSCPQTAPWQLKRLDLQPQGRRQRDGHSGEGTRGWNLPSSYPARRASSFAAVPRSARRFALSRSPWELDGTIVARVCFHRRSLSLAPAVLGQHRRWRRNHWKSSGLCACGRFLSQSSKARLHESQPLCGSTAASRREAAMLPPRGAQRFMRDTERPHDQPTFSSSLGLRGLPM